MILNCYECCLSSSIFKLHGLGITLRFSQLKGGDKLDGVK